MEAYKNKNLEADNFGNPTVFAQWSSVGKSIFFDSPAVVDTGTDVTHISDKLASLLKLECIGRWSGVEAGGPVVYWTTEVIVSVADVSQRLFAVVGGTITVLGADYLRKTNTMIDLKRNSLVSADPQRDLCPIQYKTFTVLQFIDAIGVEVEITGI